MNAELDDAPELVNKDPYGNGQLVKVAIKDTSELENLLSGEEYQAQIEA